jgi:phosphomannomutase
VHFDDFLDGVGSFPPEDIVRYFLDDGTRVIARPSGTEPKVKIYLDAEGKTAAEATKTLKSVESDIEKLVGSF